MKNIFPVDLALVLEPDGYGFEVSIEVKLKLRRW